MKICLLNFYYGIIDYNVVISVIYVVVCPHCDFICDRYM